MAEHPEKLGKYQIRGLAGRGSMGIVYLGHDPFVDRQVAIKVLTLHDEADGEARARARKMFFNEAQSAGNLDHPNILRVYDAGETDGEPYIVMEYVPGEETLRSYCTPKKQLPVETVVRLIAQCAEALDYAHSKGVTHRDIKPANIMLTKEGVAKIGDFGIAHRQHTDTTQVVGAYGSPRYMSPEQARDDTITSRSDLFSLGVVLYELLAGRPPFLAKNLPGLIYKILHDPAPPIQEFRPEIPPPLVHIISRALQKDPAKRYQSGKEMAVDLAEVFKDLSRPFGELDHAQQVQTLKGFRFFDGFSESEVEEVLRASEMEGFAPGQQILQEGWDSGSFYILVGGELLVAKGGKIIASLTPGDSFGEMGYLAESERSASVIAKSPSAALKISAGIKEWASFPCQVRLTKAFQRTLIDRLNKTSEDLSKHVG